jgi:hypothetical protein
MGGVKPWPGQCLLFPVALIFFLRKEPLICYSGVLLYKPLQLGRRYYPALPPEYLALPKQDQRGHTLHLVCGSRRRLPVYIHFNDHCLVSDPSFKIFQYRRHHLTGPAPGSKKVYQYRFIAIDHFQKRCHNICFSSTLTQKIHTAQAKTDISTHMGKILFAISNTKQYFYLQVIHDA